MVLCLQRTTATEELSCRGEERVDYTYLFLGSILTSTSLAVFSSSCPFGTSSTFPLNSDPLLVWDSFWRILFAPVSLVINPGVKVPNLTSPSLLSFAIQMYYINFKHRISPNKDHHFHPQTCIFLLPSWNLVWNLLSSHCSITSPLGPRPTQSFSHISTTSKISVQFTSSPCWLPLPASGYHYLSPWSLQPPFHGYPVSDIVHQQFHCYIDFRWSLDLQTLVKWILIGAHSVLGL